MEKDSNEKKAPAYLTKISSETFDKLKEQLLQLMVVEKNTATDISRPRNWLRLCIRTQGMFPSY